MPEAAARDIDYTTNWASRYDVIKSASGTEGDDAEWGTWIGYNECGD